MKLDPNDIRQLAEAIAESISRKSNRQNSFTVDKSRKSKNSSSIAEMFSDLDEAINVSFSDTIKRWQKAQRDSVRALKGSALKDAHNDYIDELRRITKKASGANKEYFERHVKGIENSAKMGAKRHKTQALIAVIMESELRAMKNRLKTNKGLNEKERHLLEEKIELTEKALQQAKEYNNNLLSLHEKEMQARDAIVSGMLSTIKSGAWDAVTKTLGTVDGRLRNLQSSTDYVTAAMNGLSPDQMNEFRNATTRTTAVLGETADGVYKNTMQMMNEFGYFGADAATMTSQTMNQLMAAGIAPSQAGTESIMNAISKAQIYEGMTRDEAVQLMSQEIGSEYFFMRSLNASDSQQDILIDQLVEARRANKLLGLSAGYLEQQRQEQVNARYGSIISKIQQSAMSGAYINSLKSSMGPINTREEELLRKKLNNYISDKELSEYNATIGKRIGEFSADYMKQSSAAAVSGDFSGVTGMIAVDELARRVMDVESIAKEYTAASQRVRTEGVAAATIDAQAKIDAARKSLGPIEDAAKDIGVIIKGIEASPVGMLATAIGGAVVAGMSAALGARLLDKLGGVFGGGRGPFGGGSGGLGRTRGRMRGGIGSILSGECGCDPCGGFDGMDTPDRRKGRRTRGRAAVRARRAGRSIASGLARYGPKGIPIAGSLLTAGLAYNDWSNLNQEIEAGNITQAEAKEEKGGILGALGLSTAGIIGGAAAGTAFAPGIGTLIGGLVGGFAGDFFGEKLGRSLAGDSQATSDLTKMAIMTNPAMLPASLIGTGMSFFGNNQTNPFPSASSMASGTMIDENGNVVSSSDEQLQILRNIEQATTQTASEVKKGNEESEERATYFRNRSLYEQRQQELARSMAQSHIAAIGGPSVASTTGNRFAATDMYLAFR